MKLTRGLAKRRPAREHPAGLDYPGVDRRPPEWRLSYWADPGRHERDQINTWDDGRGLYFDDPSGHLLEIITRPYASGGRAVSRVDTGSRRSRGPPLWSSGRTVGTASPLRSDPTRDE